MPTRRSVAAPRSIILNVRDSEPHGLKKCELICTVDPFCIAQSYAIFRFFTFRENNVLWLNIPMHNTS